MPAPARRSGRPRGQRPADVRDTPIGSHTVRQRLAFEMRGLLPRTVAEDADVYSLTFLVAKLLGPPRGRGHADSQPAH